MANDEFYNKKIKALDKKIFITKLLTPIFVATLIIGIILIVVGVLNEMSIIKWFGIGLSAISSIVIIVDIVFLILFRNSDKELNDLEEDISDNEDSLEQTAVPTIESIINDLMNDFEKIANIQISPTVDEYLEQYKKAHDTVYGKLIICDFCGSKYHEISGKCSSCGGANA